jgi:hypothetical protein
MELEGIVPENRRFKLITGVMAIVLAVAAVAWTMAPHRGAAQPGGRFTMAGPSGVTAQGGEVVEAAKAPVSAGPIVILPDKVDLSPPLRDIAPLVSPPAEEMLLRFREGPLPGHERGSSSGVDSTLQDWHGVDAMPSPIQNWAGINNLSGVLPPDTQGDVGPSHYIQWVNLYFRIWNKTGTSLYGPALGNTIWTGFGGKCATYNDGDPVTLYDHLADRWVMMQFAVSGSSGTSDLICIAVSQTADPTGSWHRYSYTWPNTYMPDYPKIGLWPDGYYLTVNQFSQQGLWRGGGVAAFERSAMLTGGTAQVTYYNLYSYNSAYGGMLPADWEGTTQPPSGAPCPFMEWDDSTWISPSDALRIWNFHVDWTTPANSYFGSSLAPNYTLNTADVNPTICASSPCIDQPGTAQNLDEISDRLMHRLQYRNFAGYQAMVTNHTVSIGSNAAGIHWYELRNTGSGWTIYQQGTYGPDSASRWMGSIAMDQDGNLALGFSISSSTIYPSIRYVGRLATDTLGTMPQAETTLIAGTGYQSHSAARWGDYSAMQVDPSDGCTFWYTQEYIATSGSAPWVTRIGAFNFGTSLCNPTAVELARFEGWPEGPAVHVEWETVTEIDNLGFNLYRAGTADGPYVKLNEELIPSQVPGSPVGAVYVWLDDEVQAGHTYYYKLEDLDIYGHTTLHGPVQVRVGPTLHTKP